MKTRKVPLRKCIACQEMKPKRQLIRVVRTPDGEVQLDVIGKKAGRGAYICGEVTCFQLARKQKSFDRALKQSVHQDVYAQLERQFVQEEAEWKAQAEQTADEEEDADQQ
jgi:uncharacterized protein